jgi:hypothetical protein
MSYSQRLARALNAYLSWGEKWGEIYAESVIDVKVALWFTQSVYLLTIIQPIIDDLAEMLRLSKAIKIKNMIQLFYDLITLPYDDLASKYGSQDANAIFDILVKHNLCSSSNFDPFELYEEMTSNPSEALKALEEIEEKVFKMQMDPDTENLMTNFLYNLGGELLTGVLGEYLSTDLTLLNFYYKTLNTEEISYELLNELIELDKSIYEGILYEIIPLSLASAIEESYSIPMAEAINSATELAGRISKIYYDMNEYGYEITHPQDTISAPALDLTKSQIWSSLVGLEYIAEYRYWELTYYYLSRELTTSQSDLSQCRNRAQEALSNAEGWRNALVNILALSQCDVESHDPGGVNFSLKFSPPPTSSPFPVVPKNSSGFVLVANRTSSLTLSSGNYKFIVENRTWFSNFTYSLYVDDAYGNSYLIVFNPPQQQYSVEMENEAPVMLRNFALTNDGVKVSDAGKATGKHVVFNVVGFNVDPASVTVVPSQGKPSQATLPTAPFQLIFLSIASIVILVLIGIYLRRRRTPPPPPPPP